MRLLQDLPVVRRTSRLARDVAVNIRAYRWATSQLSDVRARLAVEGVTTRAAPPGRVNARGRRGLERALRRVDPTCLERALVLQAWQSAFTHPPAIVIGVRRHDATFEAHAWVEGADTWSDDSYEELTRLEM